MAWHTSLCRNIFLVMALQNEIMDSLKTRATVQGYFWSFHSRTVFNAKLSQLRVKSSKVHRPGHGQGLSLEADLLGQTNTSVGVSLSARA